MGKLYYYNENLVRTDLGAIQGPDQYIYANQVKDKQILEKLVEVQGQLISANKKSTRLSLISIVCGFLGGTVALPIQAFVSSFFTELQRLLSQIGLWP